MGDEMKNMLVVFASLIITLCCVLQPFAWGDVAVETVQSQQSNADSRLLVLMAVAAAVLLVSIGTTISLRKQYLSEEEEKEKDKDKPKTKHKKK